MNLQKKFLYIHITTRARGCQDVSFAAKLAISACKPKGFCAFYGQKAEFFAQTAGFASSEDKNRKDD